MASSLETTPDLSNSSFRHRRDDSMTTYASVQPASPTLTKSTSNLYEYPWDKQCVLSLDGGGIRGYSSLVILGRLMEEIRDIEIREAEKSPEKIPEGGHSSYAPRPYVQCIDNGEHAAQGMATTAGDDCCRYIPCHYFDYIGGTSTGGLISIMLGRLRMSVKHAMEEYEKLAGDIFGHPRWASVRGPIPWLRDKYDGRTVQRAVEDVVERRMHISEREIGAGGFNSPPGLCRTLVFAYASSKSPSEYGSGGRRKKRPNGNAKKVVKVEGSAPYIFRSYDHWGSNPPMSNERNPGVAANVPIWEAARATTAAPSYFNPIRIGNRKFGDGGFGTNNPAEEMLAEVAAMNGQNVDSVALLLSIGTGDSDISRFEKGPLRKYLGYFNAARKLASDSKAPHERLLAQKQWREDFQYHRFNVPTEFDLGKMKLDEWKKPGPLNSCTESTIEKIRKTTERYCDQQKVKTRLQKVARILVRQRKLRAESDLWPFRCSGLQYRCTVKKCPRCQELKLRREELEDHLKEKHSNELLRRGESLDSLVAKGTCPPVLESE